MNDPLAGKREAINAGEVDHLTWPDEGAGCPVQRDQVFELRSCHIVISETQRTRSKGDWIWVAKFNRFPRNADRLRLLRPGYGTTEDPDQAMRLEDADRDVVARTFGHWPSEPEAIADDEVRSARLSREAAERFERERQEEQAELEREPIADRLRRLEEAQAAGAPVGREIRAIHGQLAKAERKAGIRRAA